MCFNAKGFGDWGEGIAPDVDITIENEYGVKDEYYPLPYTDWGDANLDVALAVALADITGESIQGSTRSLHYKDIVVATQMEREVAGLRLYHND